MIDLHTHTTASDGRCSPADLVARASAAGVRVLSLTDHDTVAGYGEAAAACADAHIELVPGIEITAVSDEADVHMLGYFIDVSSPVLADFLARQRRDRMNRIEAMVERLRGFGIVLDADTILKPAREDTSKAAGRPWVARALVAAGHVPSVGEAFNRWLNRGRPAFVPRTGSSPETVIARVHDPGGIASIAHPGSQAPDEWLQQLVDAGLDAVEAYHSEHDAATTARCLAFAKSAGIAVTGGSDYHGDPAHGGRMPGSVSLPHEAFEHLKNLVI